MAKKIKNTGRKFGADFAKAAEKGANMGADPAYRKGKKGKSTKR